MDCEKYTVISTTVELLTYNVWGTLQGGSDKLTSKMANLQQPQQQLQAQHVPAIQVPRNLPCPPPFELHSKNAAETWANWRQMWNHYALATGVIRQNEDIQVATLLTVIGMHARKVYSTFRWTQDGDQNCIQVVLDKFEAYI